MQPISYWTFDLDWQDRRPTLSLRFGNRTRPAVCARRPGHRAQSISGDHERGYILWNCCPQTSIFRTTSVALWCLRSVARLSKSGPQSPRRLTRWSNWLFTPKERALKPMPKS